MKRLLFSLLITTAWLSVHANDGGCNFTAEITPSGSTTFCSGDSITLTATAGATYEWNTGATTQSIVVNFPGNYTVTVTDSLGCDDSDNQFVTVIPSPIATIIPSEEPPYCAGEEITLFTTFTPFGSYEWSTGETTLSINVTQSDIYSVTVTSPAGCSDTATLPVGFIPDIPIFTFEDGPTTFCEGESVTITSSVFIGGTFYWYPNGETTRSITVTESGDYYVDVLWATGCTSTSEVVEVNVVPVPMAYAGEDTALCNGDNVEITGTGGSVLQWSTGSTDSAIVVGEGTYILSANNPGCDIISKDTISVIASGVPQPVITYDAHVLGEPVNFTGSYTDSISSWYWYFGDNDEAEGQNPSHTYTTAGDYTVTLVVTNQYGCEGFSQENIEINHILQLPTVFTPNGDGSNDLFLIENESDGSMNIEIYDRWGNIVFNKEAREIRWDGRNNSGTQLDAGTYYYVLNLDVFANQRPTTQAGFLTLIR